MVCSGEASGTQVVGKELEPAAGAYTKLNDSSFGLFVLKCKLKRHIAEY